MKKTFFQLNIGAWFARALMLFFVGIGIYCLVISIFEKSIVLTISGILVIVIFVRGLISDLYYRIIFYDEKIFITGELIEGRTQYKDEILYNDIENINLIYANKNSRKQYNKVEYMRPRMFFEFKLKSGDSKWVYISFFSKKQKNKMLEIINSKTSLNLTYDKMLKQLSANDKKT